MSFVAVADLETPHEAQLARGMLRAHGIPAETTDDHRILPTTISGRVSGTAVVVPPAYAEEARALLPDAAQPGRGPAAPPFGGDAAAQLPGVAASMGTPSSERPLAARRAQPPRWATVLALALLALVVWLLLEVTGALATASPVMFFQPL